MMIRINKTYIHIPLRNLFWIFILLGISLQTCKQAEFPEEIIGDPTFYLEGQIDGKNLDLVAGLDDYYMKTEYFQDALQVYSFSGTLTQLDCDKCPESMQVIIRDVRARELASAVVIDSAIETKTYSYYHDKGGNNYVLRVSFQNQSGSGGGGGTYSWDFGDSSTHIGINPIHDYTDTSRVSANVCLESTDPSGCVTTICNEIKLKEQDCQVDFVHHLDSSISYVTFMADVQGDAPFDFQWDFGDGFSASLGNPGYFYGNPGLYTVCLTVTDANGCEASICKNIAADPTFCENNFTYEVQKKAAPDPYQFSTITVNWRDQSGKKYTSASELQPSNSSFEILEILPYEENEAGEKVLRLKVKFSCELYHNDEVIQLEDAIGYIGIAYP